MGILIDENTTAIVQGFTGQTGMFHSMEMIEYGTRILGGVTPGKGGGGSTCLNRPVFDTMKEAVEATGATACISFVPPPFAADGIMEAADAGIRYCVCITDGIPAHDMIRVKRYMRRYKAEKKMVLTGPNCAGTITPGKSMLGIMPPNIYMKGKVGIIGRSGTLGYEAASQLKAMGIGISTSVGIGGDPINGSSFRDHLARFEEDSETKVVVMIGEIGGPQETNAAYFYKENMKTPVVGYVAGLTAPKGRRMGHAGAVISAFGESAAEKVEVFQECGIKVVPSSAEFGQTVADVFSRH